MPRHIKQFPPAPTLHGIPDFRNGIAKWNAAWEARNYYLMCNLCNVQEEMRVLAVTTVLQPNSCWKTHTHGARGAYAGGTPANLLAGTGIYAECPHVYPLETDNGEGFLALLKRYVLDSEVNVIDGGCISYLHPEWTDETIERLEKAGQAGVQTWIAVRDDFLSDFTDWMCS
ncbi:hypothetical protein B0H14DRAFT_3453429 [Mycena olivaceomarginata]|nr:hypothetical protein B0H14DRAFT_3453429 [Mycena olivaceomarginata]